MEKNVQCSSLRCGGVEVERCRKWKHTSKVTQKQNPAAERDFSLLQTSCGKHTACCLNNNHVDAQTPHSSGTFKPTSKESAESSLWIQAWDFHDVTAEVKQNLMCEMKAALILIWFHRWTLCHTAHFQIHFSDAKWMKRLNKPAGWTCENLTAAAGRADCAQIRKQLTAASWFGSSR